MRAPLQKCVEMLLPVLRNSHCVSTDQYLEKQLVIELMYSLLRHLSVESRIEKKHSAVVKALESEGYTGVDVEALGIGCKKEGSETWYGSPDGRVRGISPDPDPTSDELTGHHVNVLGIEEPSSDTDGGSSIIEFKLKMKALSQMIGMVVVSSFTEHNLHRRENPMVPTLIINCSTFKVILYDCEKDILLISDPVDIFNESERIKKSTILLMWLFINHRSV